MEAKRLVNRKRMAFHATIIFSVVGGLLYGAQNCGKQGASSLNTLDNFAAGNQIFLNQCSADPDHRTRRVVAAAMAKVLVLDEEGRHPMTIATHDVLTAIPDQLLLWSMRHFGTVIVSPETAELCSAGIPDQGGPARTFKPGSLNSCFVYIPATGATPEVLNFNVANDPKEIQHSLLKTFASAISQLAPEIQPEIYPALLAFEKNVARAFVADLVDKRQGAFNISALKSFLGKYDLDKIEKLTANYIPGADLKNDPLDLFSFDPDETSRSYRGFAFNKKRFLDFTFAEAFDSYFCNNWGTFNEGKAKSIARGDQPLTGAMDLANTRKRMAVFFPRTHKVFAAGIGEVLKALEKGEGSSLTSDTQGFSLGGGGRNPPSRQVQYESPAWAGTKAFFGSIWGNTGGAAANAYGKYSDRVESSVNNYYEGGGKSIVGAVANGVGGGVSKTYETEVAAPIREQTDKRFQTQLAGGASIREAAVNSVLLAVGDQTGATPFVEGAYGVDTTDARFLSPSERALRVAQGGVQLIDTATGIGGIVGVGKAGNKVAAATAREVAATERAAANTLNVGEAFNGAGPGTGLWKAAEGAKAGPSALKATQEAFGDAAEKGLAKDADKFLAKKYADGSSRLESYAAGMSEDATKTTLKKGDKLYVVTDATQGTDVDKLVWGANKPPHPDVVGSQSAYQEFVNQTALPELKGGAKRTNARVIELEVTADVVPAVNSTVQPNFGKQGGAQQTFLAYNKDEVAGTNLFKVVGDTADPAKPIGVYQQYDQFMQNFDELASAKVATTEAKQAFKGATSEAIQNFGKLEAANLVYQGAGESFSEQLKPDASINLGSAKFDPFENPKGAQPDILQGAVEPPLAPAEPAAAEEDQAH